MVSDPRPYGPLVYMKLNDNGKSDLMKSKNK